MEKKSFSKDDLLEFIRAYLEANFEIWEVEKASHISFVYPMITVTDIANENIKIDLPDVVIKGVFNSYSDSLVFESEFQIARLTNYVEEYKSNDCCFMTHPHAHTLNYNFVKFCIGSEKMGLVTTVNDEETFIRYMNTVKAMVSAQYRNSIYNGRGIESITNKDSAKHTLDIVPANQISNKIALHRIFSRTFKNIVFTNSKNVIAEFEETHIVDKIRTEVSGITYLLENFVNKQDNSLGYAVLITPSESRSEFNVGSTFTGKLRDSYSNPIKIAGVDYYHKVVSLHNKPKEETDDVEILSYKLPNEKVNLLNSLFPYLLSAELAMDNKITVKKRRKLNLKHKK